VAAYVDCLVDAGRKSASICWAVDGIASIHQLSNVVDPSKQTEARLAMRRMHRKLGRFSHRAQGIRKDILKKMLAATDISPWGIREHALILLAYETLCRRSELISIRIEDIYRQSIES
jgi:integrase